MLRGFLILAIACLSALAQAPTPPVTPDRTYGCVIQKGQGSWEVRLWTGTPEHHEWDFLGSKRDGLRKAMNDCDKWMRSMNRQVTKKVNHAR